MDVAVLGMGAWGTALARHLSRRHAVRWWGRAASARKAACAAHPQLTVADSPAACARGADWAVLAVPVAALEEVACALRDADAPVLWACKGLEPGRLRWPAQILADALGADAPIAGLSGPSFAAELAAGQPTAAVAVAADAARARAAAALFHHEHLSVYASADMIGVQLGGAVKNVLAIACGAAQGLGFGANTRAALITRGLHEMAQLGARLGARPETLYGLSGLGDAVLSCSSPHSRNFRLGQLLGSGLDCAAALREIGQVAEGRHTAQALRDLRAQHGLELPLCTQVAEVLDGRCAPRDAVASLLARDPGTEEIAAACGPADAAGSAARPLSEGRRG